MARVTVEKCKDKTNSNYELVVLAAHRAKDINSGGVITIERDKDKDSVLALREIEAGYVKIPELREKFIASLQSSTNIEVVPEDQLLKDDIDDDLNMDSELYELSEEELDLNFDVTFEDEDILDEDDEK